MRVLAFDTSGAGLSAVVLDGGRELAAFAQDIGRGHAEQLLPALVAVIEEAGLRWSDLDVVGCTVGPGSFTGLRAGIAVARALSLAGPLPTFGVGTLEAMALGCGPGGEPVLASIDARRDQVYAQLFAPDLAPLSPPALLSVEEAQALLPPRARLVGSGSHLLVGRPSDAQRMVEAPLHARYVAAMMVLQQRDGAQFYPGTELRPLYLRAPDARPSAGQPLVVGVGAA
ncbi:MAG: tRNA (adenosine(37)-N6)-threonylcarbamoyltransferase complex dimerization subunit type 1 TsaB [Geminicoccaceae bacterium]